jgi:hypothetical protein
MSLIVHQPDGALKKIVEVEAEFPGGWSPGCPLESFVDAVEDKVTAILAKDDTQGETTEIEE